jgi:hypothetical protein
VEWSERLGVGDILLTHTHAHTAHKTLDALTFNPTPSSPKPSNVEPVDAAEAVREKAFLEVAVLVVDGFGTG